MQIDAIDYRQTYPFRVIDSFSYRRLSDVTSVERVLECIDALRESEPDYRFLCTLDELNQCCYTSGHASENEHISLDYDDIDFDDPDAVQALEARKLAHVAVQLQAPELRLNWEDVLGTLATSLETVNALVAMNREPDGVLDDVVYVQRLSVSIDDLTIAGLPNGYFTCDWNLFQNHAVIRHMQAKHGYRFFGIGASWLGFIREYPLQQPEAERLIADLASLYGVQDAVWADLSEVLQTSRTLLLGYTENFAE